MIPKMSPYDSLASGLTGTWTAFMIQGLGLVLLGLLIIVFPELIIVMVAATFIFLGIICLAIAFKTRRVKADYIRLRDELWRVD